MRGSFLLDDDLFKKESDLVTGCLSASLVDFLIKKNGATIVQVIRKGYIVRDSADFTESSRTKIRPDTTIINDSDLDALIEVSSAVFNDYLAKELLPEYRSSDFNF